jgi:CHAT domain-containing protein
VADAKTVIASLWSVNDEATGLLIAEFYRNLWEKKLPKGEALRQAQLKMLRGELVPVAAPADGARGLKRPEAPRDYRNPYYWAAFVLSGDWR